MSGIVNILGAASGVVGATTGAGGFESGTKQVFHQTASPTGWTKLTASGTGDDSIDNICLRCVTGTITDGVGGTVAMTTALASQAVSVASCTTSGASCTPGGTTSGSHTIATNQMPSHTHSQTTNCYGSGSRGQQHLTCGPCCSTCNGCPTGSTGGTAGHTHSVSMTSHTHGHTAHTHAGTAINLAVKYVDVIVASKD